MTTTHAVRTPAREVAPPPTSTPAPAPPPAVPAEDHPVERLGLYARHAWLTPASAIAMVVAAYVAMVVLTWAAGGPTPFTD